MRIAEDTQEAFSSSTIEGKDVRESELQFMQMRASRGYVKDAPSISGKNLPIVPYDYSLFLDMIRNDPVLSTAIDTTVDVVTRNGYYFIAKSGKRVSELRLRQARELFDDVLDFDTVIDNILYQLVIHHISYLELVGFESSGKSEEIHALETSEMAIRFDEHGEITGYVQNPLSGGREVSFTKEEIVLFRFKTIGSQVYPYNNLEPIARTYVNSLRAHDYLAKVFVNMPPKLIYALKSANKDQRQQFIANLRIAKTKYDVDIVATSKDGLDVLSSAKPELLAGLLEILEYLREQVLMVMRVPPVWVGLVNSEGANRGNAEAQIYSFETRVRKLQQRVESQINKELMPKLGFGDIYFRWNNISLQDESKTVQNAAVLSSIGLDGESVISYLRSKGVNLPIEAKIEQLMQDNQAATNKTAPSRQGMDKKNESMNSEVGKKGTSDAGGAKLETKKENTR